jgi:hypothetical protein
MYQNKEKYSNICTDINYVVFLTHARGSIWVSALRPYSPGGTHIWHLPPHPNIFLASAPIIRCRDTRTLNLTQQPTTSKTINLGGGSQTHHHHRQRVVLPLNILQYAKEPENHQKPLHVLILCLVSVIKHIWQANRTPVMMGLGMLHLQ